MSAIRILIADDHEAVRLGLRSILAARSDYVVCGEAADGFEAIEKAKSLRPNVILMDVSMPRLDGVAAAKIIGRDLPHSQVIIVSQNDAAVSSAQAAKAKAAGFVFKADVYRDLPLTIDRVLAERGHTIAKEETAVLPPESDTGETQESLGDQIRSRFGLLPNFFQLGPETPEIRANLFAFAKFAYFDCPMPSLFKERLFVHLSRFCAVRYCIARHLGFLAGLGHASGDPQAPVQTVEEIVQLLQRPFPSSPSLSRYVALVDAVSEPLSSMPESGTEMEEAIFALATHVFLQTADATVCLNALTKIFDARGWQFFLLFLAFIRTAHYWTKIHPELIFEDDIRHLLENHETLARCVLDDPEAKFDSFHRSSGDKLSMVRQPADSLTSLLAAIVESSEDAIVSKTLDGVITSWNRGAERIFGYTAAEAIGQRINLIIPRDRWDEEDRILERLRRGETIGHFETVRLHKSGELLDISLTISPVMDSNGTVVGASKVARDVSGRKQLDRVLRDSEERFRTLAGSLESQVRARTQELERRNFEILEQSEQLRELSNRLLQSQDHERRRIARELHDSAGQIIAVLAMAINDIGQRAKADPALAKVAQSSQELVQQLNDEIRTMSYLLHPPLLDENGLLDAIRWYIQGATERSGISIHLIVGEDFGRVPREMELAVFRIVQEALTNIHRHSGSKTATIRLSRTADGISLEIEDEGKGIPAEKLKQIKARTGVGIAGMRERARHFGGDVQIDSNERGTKISVSLPLEREANAASEA